MKRIILSGIALLILLTAGTFIHQQKSVETGRNASPGTSLSAHDTRAATSPKPDSMRTRTQTRLSNESQAPSPLPREDLTAESLERLLRQERIDTAYGFDGILKELRAYDDKHVAQSFYELLHDERASDFYLRTKMVQVANRFQSPHAFPLWKDLILRNPPLYPSEDKILEADEPSMEANFINFEVYNAIRNLGILGQDNVEAKDLLAEIIGMPSDGRYQKFMREQAFFALREADLSYANRILKDLSIEDDLRKRIKTVGP